MFIHSANQSTTEWISFAHNKTDAVIGTGKGFLSHQQSADGPTFGTGVPVAGLRVNGFDDKAASYLNMCIDDLGLGVIGGNVGTIYFSPVNSMSVYFNVGGIGVRAGKSVKFGSLTYEVSVIEHSGVQTAKDTLMIGLNDDVEGDYQGRALIICDKNDVAFDFEHPAQDNPTLFVHSANQSTDEWISFAHDQTDGQLRTGTGDLQVGEKTKMTRTGGFAILLTNKTGANSVAGQLVRADPATDDAVILTAATDDECFGVFLDGGVADGSEAWVVVSGIADVMFDDNVAAVRGNWVGTGQAGLARTQGAPPALGIAAHFEELGHCIENVTAGGGGTFILARCVLHFN